MEDDLEKALNILKEALAEHEEIWGPVEAFTGDEDWAVRAAALLAKHETTN